MRTRGIVWVLLAGALVLVLATGAALAAQTQGDRGEDKSGDAEAKDGDDSRNDGGQALEFEARPTSVNGFVDLSLQGANPGDLLVISDELYRTGNGQNSSEKVGHADGRCTLIDPSNERFMCTVIASFENGTIVTEGVLVNNQNSPSAASVTGGTGEYRGVTGEAALDLAPPEGPHGIRFDLQRTGAGSRSGQKEEAGQQQQEEETTQEETQAKAAEAKDTNRDSAEKAGNKNANRDSAGKAKGETRDR